MAKSTFFQLKINYSYKTEGERSILFILNEEPKALQVIIDVTAL